MDAKKPICECIYSKKSGAESPYNLDGQHLETT